MVALTQFQLTCLSQVDQVAYVKIRTPVNGVEGANPGFIDGSAASQSVTGVLIFAVTLSELPARLLPAAPFLRPSESALIRMDPT